MQSTDDSRIVDLAIRMLFLGLAIFGALMIVLPLATLVVWAAIMATALYPAHRRLSGFLGGRETVSAVFLTLIGLVLTLGPLAASVTALVEVGGNLAKLVDNDSLTLPALPAFVAELPFIGKKLADIWTLVSSDLAAAIARYGSVLADHMGAVMGAVAGLGGTFIGMSISVLIMGLLLKPGARFAQMLRSFGDRIFAPSGGEFVTLAGATVRNVTRGVIGIAVLQSLALGIVMGLFGIPAAGALAGLALFLAIIQVGPGIVVLPVVIWAWVDMGTLQAVLFTLLMLPITMADNVLRPLWIAKGLKTPMLVIIVGVLGGMLSLGLIGLFIGPILLSVFYELVMLWMSKGAEGPEEEGGAAGIAAGIAKGASAEPAGSG